MTRDEAKTILDRCASSYFTDDDALVGQAIRVLLCEGYHSFEFEMLDDGGVTLHTSGIEVTVSEDCPKRGHVQRSTELLVRAAEQAVPTRDGAKGAGT